MTARESLEAALAAGHHVTIELRGFPASARRVTMVADFDGAFCAFDGQELDAPWAVRPPTIIDDLQGTGPTWTAGNKVLRDHSV